MNETSTSQRPARQGQAADEVIIRGPKRGAEEAKDELLSLLQYIIDTSHTDTISVAQSQIPSLIGTGGREMDQLRLSTGAHIDVPGARDLSEGDGRVEIKLKGTKKQVEDAKRTLQERVKVFDSTVSRNLNVHKEHHKALIGAGGEHFTCMFEREVLISRRFKHSFHHC